MPKLQSRPMRIHGVFTALRDERGSIHYGWLNELTFFARSSGYISAALGEEYAAALQSSTVGDSFHYLSDASTVSSYDDAARSAFLEFVLATRRLDSITTLVWSGFVAGPTASHNPAISIRCEVLTDAAVFEARMLTLAPEAKELLKANALSIGRGSV